MTVTDKMISMTSRLAFALVVAGLVAGCRAEEQGRPLDFKPGVYQGEKTAPLSDQQRRELRERSERQGG